MKKYKWRLIFKVSMILVMILAVIGIVIIYVLWAKTPELTSMQMMIQWWWLYIITFVLWLSGYVFFALFSTQKDTSQFISYTR